MLKKYIAKKPDVIHQDTDPEQGVSEGLAEDQQSTLKDLSYPDVFTDMP